MALGFAKHQGGDRVTFGFYWNVAEWEAQIVPAAGGELKGGSGDRYVRLPLLALLVIAPLMGAAYAFFLPFIGFAMVVAYLLGRLKPTMVTTPPPAAEHGASAAPATGPLVKEGHQHDHRRKAA